MGRSAPGLRDLRSRFGHCEMAATSALGLLPCAGWSTIATASRLPSRLVDRRVTRRRSFVTILATASIVLAGLGTGPMPRTAAEEVESRVRQWDEAWARSDVATLDRLL